MNLQIEAIEASLELLFDAYQAGKRALDDLKKAELERKNFQAQNLGSACEKKAELEKGCFTKDGEHDADCDGKGDREDKCPTDPNCQ